MTAKTIEFSLTYRFEPKGGPSDPGVFGTCVTVEKELHPIRVDGNVKRVFRVRPIGDPDRVWLAFEEDLVR